MDDQKRRDDGMAQRRKVLGDAWVDKSVANRNSFNGEFIDLITRHAWGEIWTGPHFDQRTRRVLVIGTMLALGQWDEFRLLCAQRWRKAASRPTISRRFCCSRRSIAACPRPTMPSRRRQRLFRNWDC